MPYDLAQLTDGFDVPRQQAPFTGAELTLQRIRLRLALHRGEWLLDTDVGLPWLGWAQIRPAPVEAISLAVQRVVQECPGVTACRVQRAELDDGGALTLTLQVALDEGSATVEVLTSPLGPDGNAAPWAPSITIKRWR